MNVFDILGPVMIGPSSSHTAGAARIGLMTRALLGKTPVKAHIFLHGSFAKTYKGHGTDKALVAGILGMQTDDERIRFSLDVAKKEGLEIQIETGELENTHPNTAEITLTAADGEKVSLRGSSIGGGNILITRVNGMEVALTGQNPALIVLHKDAPGTIAAVTELMAEYGGNICNFHLARETKGKGEFTVDLNYHSIESLLKAAKENNCRLSALVLEQQAEQMELPKQEIYKKMRENYRVMASCIQPGSAPDLKSTSGLTGGDAYRMRTAVEQGKNLTGPLLGGALYRALAVSELNASMGRIVAAPTAGSCGIVPAAVLTMQEQYQLTEEECVMSLFTASAVGMVIANNASLAGAQGGCQAECGSASAMAAAAIVELAGGTPDMIQSAVATALKNILGLVCDPVAGLVEIPCIKRNASGVAGAFVAAELALAGIRSAIPADEVIWTMKKVGDVMPTALKETAEGGLAATPTGRKLHQQVFGEMK